MSHCPKCSSTIDLDADELEEGEIISCPECSAELEVVNTHPVELDVVGDEEEDDELEGEDEDEDEELFEEEDDELEDEEDNGFH